MALPSGDLPRLSLRQILDALAEEPVVVAQQYLNALRDQLGLHIAATLGATLQISREEWLDQVRAGRAFAGFGNQAAVAAQFSHVQLFNPASSGVRLLVYRIFASSSLVTAYKLCRHDTELPTDATTKANLLTSGSAPVARVRITANAVEQGSQFGQHNGLANDARVIADDWLGEVAEGHGLLIRQNQVNADLAVTYFWLEVPLVSS